MVQARFFARGIQNSHLKPLKINCFWVIVHVCLNLDAGRPSLKKVCDTIGKWIFFQCVILQSLNFLWSKNEVLFFTPLAHNLTSKTGIFLKLSDGQNGNFNNHNQLIIQMICIASCIEEIYLKVLDKQSSWTYVRLIFERFVVISWLWFALDHLKCWEDRC